MLEVGSAAVVVVAAASGPRVESAPKGAELVRLVVKVAAVDVIVVVVVVVVGELLCEEPWWMRSLAVVVRRTEGELGSGASPACLTPPATTTPNWLGPNGADEAPTVLSVGVACVWTWAAWLAAAAAASAAACAGAAVEKSPAPPPECACGWIWLLCVDVMVTEVSFDWPKLAACPNCLLSLTSSKISLQFFL